ncbi:hypothetical protein CLOSS21_00440 [Clostridium sp. SS2/1]|nr:hypothetical protein CLOSS21_00440 [Clostridium sp. SS2/1]
MFCLVYFIKNLLLRIIPNKKVQVNRPCNYKRYNQQYDDVRGKSIKEKNMKKQLKGKQSFYDDKQRENVVSYYLMEDQEHTMYGVELEKYQEETNVIEWDAVPSISESMELVDRVIHNLIKYKVTPISLAESLDEIMTREEEDGRSKI